jgi:ferrous iron transport protein A
MATAPDRCIAASDSIGLTDLPEGTVARVVRVSKGCAGAPLELSKRLAELGFLPGERVRIVGRGWFAREPLAVRIGTGTFALRLYEAACVQVCPEPAPTA